MWVRIVIMSRHETRHSLIVRLQDTRNAEAWEQFASAYEPFLQRMAQRQGVPDRHVPDAVQQVLLAVAGSVKDWRNDGNPGSFRRWLTTVSRHAVIRFMKRERRHAGAVGGTEMLQLLGDFAADNDPADTRRYEHELLVWAAEQVRPAFAESSWRAFVRTMLSGQPVAEVAAELGITPGSIYMSRSRIMAAIREKVREVTWS